METDGVLGICEFQFQRAGNGYTHGDFGAGNANMCGISTGAGEVDTCSVSNTFSV